MKKSNKKYKHPHLLHFLHNLKINNNIFPSYYYSTYGSSSCNLFSKNSRNNILKYLNIQGFKELICLQTQNIFPGQINLTLVDQIGLDYYGHPLYSGVFSNNLKCIFTLNTHSTPWINHLCISENDITFDNYIDWNISSLNREQQIICQNYFIDLLYNSKEKLKFDLCFQDYIIIKDLKLLNRILLIKHSKEIIYTIENFKVFSDIKNKTINNLNISFEDIFSKLYQLNEESK